MQAAISAEYEGSELYDFSERGKLGDGSNQVNTFVLKLPNDGDGRTFKNFMLNSMLSEALMGAGIGSCAEVETAKDRVEEYENRIDMLETRLSNMRGGGLGRLLDIRVQETGMIPATSLWRALIQLSN